MRTLKFDSLGGASGDMILAALCDLGAPLGGIEAGLRALPLGDFRVRAEPVREDGLCGTRVHVDVSAPHPAPSSPHGGGGHPHRGWREIRGLLESSALPAAVRDRSLEVFGRLARAEAKVHGVDEEEVRFHEVGAVDSIVDIVGSCAAIEALEVDRVVVGPLPLGHGTVATEHGLLPVPAPATLELLRGHPLAPDDEPSELVTPTAAALLTAWRDRPSGRTGPEFPEERLAVDRVGHGFGHRRLRHRPNLLRAILMVTAPASPPSAPDAGTDVCLVLECNIDNTVPELIGSLCQALMDKGALDVFTTGIQMKKQRPGILLTALCRPRDRSAMLDLIFRESGTLGVRERTTTRTVLDRRASFVETPYGRVRVKVSRWGGRDLACAPEHEDCVRLAHAANVSVRSVYEAALRAGIPAGG